MAKLQTTKRARAFGVVLSGAFSLTMLATAGSAAHPEARDFDNRVFEVTRGAVAVRAEFLNDGALVLSGPHGRFEGRWRILDNQICTDFQTGPRAGVTCHTLSETASGGYATEDGAVLTPVARVVRF
ncbi:hypothetical protein KUH32_14050 [Thalassococcus sp. CAU 1522]|uniref:Dihydrodipicolinate reductase n=1 Tax=Thalassococcus arenae TaxID=2851652 RepID=A0ABS6NA35_9RHOB|nr:hypothetical protein [Thalassococcus arenae]MBV2360886.1 hypothetical protein [Thalassococcus arenae]